VVNSLQRPLCQRVTRQWEALGAELPANVSIYTVSMDSPQLQAGFQESAGVLHQALSAQRSDQFGQDYGVWLAEWRLLQRAIFVIDQNARIIYTEYVADQHNEPTYAAARQAVALAAAA
jgi:thiol peroxidase